MRRKTDEAAGIFDTREGNTTIVNIESIDHEDWPVRGHSCARHWDDVQSGEYTHRVVLIEPKVFGALLGAFHDVSACSQGGLSKRARIVVAVHSSRSR